MASFVGFVREQFTALPYPDTQHTGQTVIVTGSNVGLGLEAARHFTRLNAEKVILAVRSLEKGENAKKSIEETTGRAGVLEVWQLDLSSYESVKEFVKKAEGLKRLDAIVENAGISRDYYSKMEDNESTITTVRIVNRSTSGQKLISSLERRQYLPSRPHDPAQAPGNCWKVQRNTIFDHCLLRSPCLHVFSRKEQREHLPDFER